MPALLLSSGRVAAAAAGGRARAAGGQRRARALRQPARFQAACLDEALASKGKLVSDGLRGVSIYLVGMMGSGKSTVGAVLGEALSYPVFDSDTVVEGVAGGRSVADIFAEDGEEAFRELESAVLKELCAFHSTVVCTGGGAVTRRQNWGYINHGVSVYLSVPAEVLASRVAADGPASRPLAGDGEAVSDSLERILEERQAQYTNADITVEVEKGDTPEDVAARVLDGIEERLREQITKEKMAQMAADSPDGLLQ